MKYASIILFSLFFLSQPAMSETLSFTCTAGNTVFKDALQINKEVEQARFGEWPFASYSENQSAIGWSVRTTLHARKSTVGTTALTSGSLIVTALCSILLLAGQLESQEPSWYATLGLLLFCLVTVLGDGVGWNARFLVRSSPAPLSVS